MTVSCLFMRGNVVNMETELVIRWYKKLGEKKHDLAFHQD